MEFLANASGLLVAAGLLLIVAGVIGGGLQIKEVTLPKISLGTRIVCFVVGALLLGLAMYHKQPDRPHGESSGSSTITQTTANAAGSAPMKPANDTQAVSIPEFKGPLEAAKKEVQSKGFALGEVLSTRLWAVDGFVVDQDPEAGSPVAPGSKVDLVIAHSRFRFSSEREFTTPEQSVRAVAAYEVLRRRSDAGTGDVAEFVLDSGSLTPNEPSFREVIEALRSRNGTYPIQTSSDYKLESSWSALADLMSDVKDQTGHDQVLAGATEGSMKNLGKAIVIAMVQVEIAFDVRAIVTPVPKQESLQDQALELQKGHGFTSAIQVVGPSVPSDAGSARTFKITRRLPSETGVEEVGEATYSVRDGLLVRLRVGFFQDKATKKNYYSLKIARL